MRKHLRINIVLVYCVVIAIIIDSAAMYSYLTNTPLFGHGFGWPMGMICLLYVIQSKKIIDNPSLRVRLPILLLMLLLFVVVTRVNTRSFIVSYAGVFLCMFVFSYFLYQNHEMGLFLRAFSNVMIVIALISLFCWLFGSVLSILPGRTALTYFWAEHDRITYTYFYLYFENPIQNSGYGIVRNIGIFTEAPGYSGFLTYGLLVEMVLNREAGKRKKEHIFRIIIYVITLLSCGSTKGILAVMIVFLVEYLLKNVKTQPDLKLKVIIGIFIVAIAAVIGMYLLAKKLGTGSGIIRIDDMTSGIKAFLQNPVFGVGYNNIDEIIKNQLVKRSNKGLSMGITVLLAYGGLWIFGIYAGAMVVSYRNEYFRKHRKTWILTCIVLLYNLFVSNSAFSDPYIFIIAAVYAAPIKKTVSVRSGGGMNTYATTQP